MSATIESAPVAAMPDAPMKARIADAIPWLGWILFAVLIAVPMMGSSRYLVYLGTLLALQAALVTSLNIVMGYAGQFAMSHSAFYGFGAYASALLVTSLGVNFWLAVPLAMLAAGALAVVVGYPALRYTGGVHLALITFAFGELARLVIANWHSVTGGPMGMRVMYAPGSFFGVSLASAKGLYGLAAGMLLVCLCISILIRRSRFGRGLIAVREDETLASFLGVNVVGYKVAAYVVSSMLAAMVGCAYAPIMNFISPEMLSAQETISLIGVLMVGGIGTVAGPILGTLVFFGIPEALRVARLFRLVVLGVVIVLVVLFMPKGIAGVLRARMDRWKRGVVA
ncbi:MAG: branched-chain amino acid ABC transporter permease [Proteobacteria bacterium]|nr:branched-chain amino acid ABC transporter permease [Pseudomonadota bacterium]